MPVDRSSIVAILKRIHLFRGIDEQRLEAAANLVEQVDFHAGTEIYHQGDVTDYFYIIAVGRVTISRYHSKERQFVQLGYVEEDDYFGQEVLESNWERQVSAEAVSDVSLLRLTVPEFIQIIEMIPTLTPRLQLVLDSYKLMLKTYFAWQDPDETLYFIARRHPIFLWVNILQPVLFGLFFVPLMILLYTATQLNVMALGLLLIILLITFVWLLWNYIDWTNDYYVVTNRRILYQERVVLLYDSRQESPMEAIQSTSINTSQWGRWLGYGNVAIRTYIGTILFRSIASPDQVMALIQEQQTRAQTSQRRAELRAMEVTIERKIGMTAPPPVKPKPPQPPAVSPLQRFLSDLMHLRYESGGTILYRTHWFILLGKVGLQLLILLVLAFLVVFSLAGRLTAISLQATCSLSFLLGAIVFGWGLYQYLDWHNDIYLITPDQIVDVNKKPLGREFRQAAPLKNILSIEYKRLGIIGLVLNYGTVYIRVGDQQLTFDNVFNPSEVQRELFHRLAAKNYAERQATAENERQRMSEWIAAYHRVTHRSQPPPAENPPRRGGF